MADKKARMRVESLALNTVHPNTWNPSAMDKRNKTALAANLRKYGYRQGILVRKCDGDAHGDGPCDGWEIVDGEHRWKELTDQGFTHADCVIVELTKEDAMIGTLAMNNVGGEADPVAVARMIVELHEGGREIDELAELTAMKERDLNKMVELPMSKDELEPAEDAPPPVRELTIMLTEQGEQETWDAAMLRASDMLTRPDAVALVGDAARLWEQAAARGQKVSGLKLKAKVMEFIMLCFMSMTDEQAKRSYPSFPGTKVLHESNDLSFTDSRLDDL